MRFAKFQAEYAASQFLGMWQQACTAGFHEFRGMVRMHQATFTSHPCVLLLYAHSQCCRTWRYMILYFSLIDVVRACACGLRGVSVNTLECLLHRGAPRWWPGRGSTSCGGPWSCAVPCRRCAWGSLRGSPAAAAALPRCTRLSVGPWLLLAQMRRSWRQAWLLNRHFRGAVPLLLAMCTSPCSRGTMSRAARAMLSSFKNPLRQGVLSCLTPRLPDRPAQPQAPGGSAGSAAAQTRTVRQLGTAAAR
jgi:hypothetical protein